MSQPSVPSVSSSYTVSRGQGFNVYGTSEVSRIREMFRESLTKKHNLIKQAQYYKVYECNDHSSHAYMVRVYNPYKGRDKMVYFGDTILMLPERQTYLNSTERLLNSRGIYAKDDPLSKVYWVRRFIYSSGEPYYAYTPPGHSLSIDGTTFVCK